MCLLEIKSAPHLLEDDWFEMARTTSNFFWICQQIQLGNSKPQEGYNNSECYSRFAFVQLLAVLEAVSVIAFLYSFLSMIVNKKIIKSGHPLFLVLRKWGASVPAGPSIWGPGRIRWLKRVFLKLQAMVSYAQFAHPHLVPVEENSFVVAVLSLSPRRNYVDVKTMSRGCLGWGICIFLTKPCIFHTQVSCKWNEKFQRRNGIA